MGYCRRLEGEGAVLAKAKGGKKSIGPGKTEVNTAVLTVIKTNAAQLITYFLFSKCNFPNSLSLSYLGCFAQSVCVNIWHVTYFTLGETRNFCSALVTHFVVG